MDEIDRRILGVLLQNSRLSYTQIGKQVRLSRENIFYRIERMQKDGYINSFITNIDHSRLGFEQFTLCVELAKAGFPQEELFIHSLTKHPNFTWVGPSIGRWSVCFDAFARSRDDLEKIFTSFLQKHSQSVASYQILPTKHLSVWFWKRTSNLRTTPKARNKEITLDEKDLVLLRILSNNSRAQYAELAQITSLSANAVKYRIKALESSGIIQQYSLNLNHDSFGFQFCTVRLGAATPDPLINQKLLQYAESHPHVWFFYEYYRTGSVDFDIGFIFADSKELREDLANLRKAVSGDVRILDVFLPIEQSSAHSLPPAVFSSESIKRSK